MNTDLQKRNVIAAEGRDYTDAYGTVRRLIESDTCDCCLEGVIEGEDAETGETWVMGYALPKAAVFDCASNTSSASRPDAPQANRMRPSSREAAA